MIEPTMETLARRLDLVERENRRLKRAGVMALAAIAALMLMGQAMQSKVVEAEQFVVRDASGRVHAVLGTVNKRAVSLALIDKNGKPRVVLGVNPDGAPRVHLYDKNNTTRAALSTTAEGIPGLGLYDRNEKVRVALELLPGDTPALIFANKAGKVIWSAP